MAEIRRDEEESLVQTLSAQSGLSYIDLRGLTIDPGALKVISEKVAKEAELVPFELTRKRLSVALRNSNNPATVKAIKELEKSGYVVSKYMTSSASLAYAFARYRDLNTAKSVKRGVLDINPENIDKRAGSIHSLSEIADQVVGIRTINSARRVSETLESLFAGAISLDASDIHIEPEESGIRLRYRLDGVLHDVLRLEPTIYERLIARLKLLSGMILNKHDEPQDGRFSFEVEDKEIEVRASVIPGAYGESMVMRLLDPSVASFSFETLGLNKILERVMREELTRPNGMIVTTGPTGSGKTTALYAFLREIHKPGVKIITIEDPVEYKVADIVQTQVGDDYTFASGLRAILRQDPDIIMVGEIRDGEVAETSIHAAQTGHLVFSTLHTNSAAAGFARLIDLRVNPSLIGSSVNVVMGQRLARRLCSYCKESYAPSEAERRLIERIRSGHPAPPEFGPDSVICKPVGCEHCGETGWQGRLGVYEAVRVDAKVEEAILRDPREHVILGAAHSQGIPTIAEDGISRVIAGDTSLEELQRVVDLRNFRAMGTAAETVAGNTSDEAGGEAVDISKHVV